MLIPDVYFLVDKRTCLKLVLNNFLAPYLDVAMARVIHRHGIAASYVHFLWESGVNGQRGLNIPLQLAVEALNL